MNLLQCQECQTPEFQIGMFFLHYFNSSMSSLLGAFDLKKKSDQVLFISENRSNFLTSMYVLKSRVVEVKKIIEEHLFMQKKMRKKCLLAQ